MKLKFRPKRRYRRHNRFAIKLKKQTVYTVAAIWLWLIAGVVTLSFFGEGTLLVKLRESLSLRLGWLMYLVPPVVVSLSLFFFKTKTDWVGPHIPLGLLLLFLSFLGVTQAGSLGEAVFRLVEEAVATEGAVFLFLGLLLVSLIVLFNTSLDRFVNYLLSGGQILFKSLTKMVGGLTNQTKPIFPQQKLPLGKDEERTLAKAPLSPPPLSTKAAVGKTDLAAPSPLTAGDMSMWEYPTLSLLSEGPAERVDRGDTRRNASVIEKTLDSFGIKARVVEVNPGPAVTQYALEIALGTKVSKITSLSSDLALALAAPTGQVRIEAPIPGRNLVGIEIPNRGLEFVTLKRMLSSSEMQKAKSKLTVALGLDVSGSPVITDIAKMPHVLVAGTTGSGKSVLLNAWICSLMFRTTPAEVRLILVDPKRVELTGYNGVPHLMVPVIVEPDKILSSLRWALSEMETRYKQFAEVGVRNIDGYNELAGFQSMPYVVIFIDELADLMAYAPVEVEDAITRIAQMARATGIHLVVATQRPSVDVITGLIKANIPARIAFNVSSMVDSRVIIDMPGAEKLLGRGDMLYIPPDQAKPVRIQGTYVSEKEVNKVVDFFRNKHVAVHYTEEVVNQPLSAMKKGGRLMGAAEGRDPLFEEAVRLVCQHDKASASLLQRRLSLGYARAARILDQLESAGIIGPAEGSKPRDVLVKNANEFFAAQQSQEV